MLITYKLLKNTLKFTMCFIVILLFYYYVNYPFQQPNMRLISLQPEDSNNDTIFHIQANLKYILIWNKDEKFDFLGKGQNAFLKNKCNFSNCFVTSHRNMIYNDYTNFHAILFSGKKVAKTFVDGYMKLPKKRFSSQTYIFAMQDDAITYPVCHEKFDDFFNLTWTYKLDSDVVWSYFKVLERQSSKVVGPSITSDWSSKYKDLRILDKVQEGLLDKEKYAVWIVSDCNTPSKREDVIKKIKVESQDDDNLLDRVGDCGSKECIFKTKSECLNVLDAYNFYMVFESVLAEDYVTSDILNAIDHYCIPVVFGGANYSRFLPPFSYIDVAKHGTKKSAKMMDFLVNNVQAYFNYFEWHSSYEIVNSAGIAACELCEALNKNQNRVHQNFREWWNPDYEKSCKAKRKRNVRSFKRWQQEKEASHKYVIGM